MDDDDLETERVRLELEQLELHGQCLQLAADARREGKHDTAHRALLMAADFDRLLGRVALA